MNRIIKCKGIIWTEPGEKQITYFQNYKAYNEYRFEKNCGSDSTSVPSLI